MYIDSDGEYINISIEDSGIGIDNSDLDNIFERFEQIKNKKKNYKEGSGIGLSLVKSLVDMHSGKIIVESKVNIGTKFTVSIPKVINDIENKTESSYYEVDSVNRMNIEFSDIYF